MHDAVVWSELPQRLAGCSATEQLSIGNEPPQSTSTFHFRILASRLTHHERTSLGRRIPRNACLHLQPERCGGLPERKTAQEDDPSAPWKRLEQGLETAFSQAWFLIICRTLNPKVAGQPQRRGRQIPTRARDSASQITSHPAAGPDPRRAPDAAATIPSSACPTGSLWRRSSCTFPRAVQCSSSYTAK